MPDRLPSLALLVGFWIPAATVGWAVAGFAHRSPTRVRAPLMYALLTTFVLVWSAAWFFFQLHRMPPYIPGASADPTYAPPKAVACVARQRDRLRGSVSQPRAVAQARVRWSCVSLTSASRLPSATK